MNEKPGAGSESTADRELVTSRLIDAPRERVFSAFGDPAHLAQWWGPKGFTSTFHEFDLRSGGTWRFTMHGPDGGSYPNESVFVEVVAPERVVFKHVSGPQFEMTIAFAAKGDKTVVGWRQVFNTAAECRRVAKFAVEANEQNLDRLASHVLEVARTVRVRPRYRPDGAGGASGADQGRDQWRTDASRASWRPDHTRGAGGRRRCRGWRRCRRDPRSRPWSGWSRRSRPGRHRQDSRSNPQVVPGCPRGGEHRRLDFRGGA
jgi:uncharacterized protein YndB with AHSA1/START domain